MNINLSGESIVLENTKTEDLSEIIGFEKSSEFIGNNSIEEHQELINDPDCLHLTIKHKQDKRLVGFIILCGIENKNESLEFRRIFVNEKGKGFGREAIKLLKKICFDYLKFNRLWLDVHIDNLMAIQLYESENFRREGTLREAVLIDSAYKSIYIYSMLKHEYDRV